MIITALLTVLGWSSMQKYLVQSRGAEAIAVIQAIRAAEGAYYAENHAYLNVSTDSGGLWYPNQTPSSIRSAWVANHPDRARWALLAPAVNRQVQFGYLVNSGGPGTVYTVPKMPTAVVPSGTQTRDWFLIQAKGDTDDDGSIAYYAGISSNAEIVSENSME